ncbi:MAG TPA: hypothetical protein VFM93_13190 [Candidatus Limnocylindria bacterium]|nr:hypothetical protein [Candidatus Limnocylindria bacterium]
MQPLKIHKGKLLLLSHEAALVADPLCRDALDRAEDGELGPDAQRIVASIGASGPRSADQVRTAVGLPAPAFRAARERLESEGAIVARYPVQPGGQVEQIRRSATLARWDQSFTQRRKAPLQHALDDLVVLGVRAAVVVQEDEPKTWFTWPIVYDTVRRLLETGRLVRPGAGWVAAA